MGGHKNKPRIVKNGRAGYIFGPMAGEISPNIMFCHGRQKMAQMDVGGKNGLAWVRQGAGARRDRKTREKKGWMIEKDMFWDAWLRR